jgi:hypothetical protein
VNNRRNRRAEIARFRRAGVLVTWLMDAKDPSLHDVPPLLARAAHLWFEDLPAAPRNCICCLCLVWGRREVGGLLLSTPPNAIGASINAVCNRCWADQTLDEIEHAATEVLRAVVPKGNFEPLLS